LTTQTVERFGRPGNTTVKGVVQQARHCWAFSCAYSNKMLKGQAAAAAKEAWGFMTDHMLRADDATWCGQTDASPSQIRRPAPKTTGPCNPPAPHLNLQKDPSSTPI
jgi:mannose/cellobiose epimerase-like protein (N-acyl-D-glucosamine 2-epimerase family)